jgi:hypothetical protein
MTRRRWLLVVLALVVGCAVGVGVVLTVQRAHGRLAYSVAAPGEGRLKATLRDSRTGDHTSWLVLHDALGGGDVRLLNLFRSSNAAGVASVGTSKGLRLPPGVYRYGVYSTDRLYAPDDSKYWTPEYLVAEGQVTVP